MQGNETAVQASSLSVVLPFVQEIVFLANNLMVPTEKQAVCKKQVLQKKKQQQPVLVFFVQKEKIEKVELHCWQTNYQR